MIMTLAAFAPWAMTNLVGVVVFHLLHHRKPIVDEILERVVVTFEFYHSSSERLYSNCGYDLIGPVVLLL